jgi:hypothetical protein
MGGERSHLSKGTLSANQFKVPLLLYDPDYMALEFSMSGLAVAKPVFDHVVIRSCG